MSSQGMLFRTQSNSILARALLELLDVQPRRYVTVMEIAQRFDLDRARTVRAMHGAVDSGAIQQSFFYPNAVYFLPEEFVVIRATQGSKKSIEVWATPFDSEEETQADMPMRATVRATDVPPIEWDGRRHLIKLPCQDAVNQYMTVSLGPSSVFQLGDMQ